MGTIRLATKYLSIHLSSFLKLTGACLGDFYKSESHAISKKVPMARESYLDHNQISLHSVSESFYRKLLTKARLPLAQKSPI